MTTLAEPKVRPERPTLRGVRATPLAHLVVERVVSTLAFLSIFAVVAIFVFVAKEALPFLVGGGGKAKALVASTPGGEALWQPVGHPGKLNVLPLLVGTVKVTALALLFAVPTGLAAAIWVAERAPSRVREVTKPAIEMLSGLPSVLLGVLASVYVADGVGATLRPTYRLNAVVAALGLAVTIAPVVFTVAEDALRAVPRSLREGAAALGAERWQVTFRVVVPSALPGIWAALVLATGRALGETMIVLMASGNAAVLDPSPTASARTITATIASELGETARGSEHYRVLFVLGTLLFLFTLVLDRVGVVVRRKLAARLGGEGHR